MNDAYIKELQDLMDELDINIEDLDDMEVLCACTGVSCLTLASIW